MICDECKTKSLARGMKKVKCEICGEETYINYFFFNICEKCSNKLNYCQRCGKQIHIKSISEIIMHYNCYNKRFYIYRNENYLYDTQNAKEALDKYIDFCKKVDKLLI